MATVTVNVRARDLTRGELGNLRRNFSRLGGDMNRLVGRRTQMNFDALNDSLRRSNAALQDMRGRIPDAEFQRLNARLVQTDRILARGLQGLNRGTLNALRNNIRSLDDDFDRLSRQTPVRIRTVVDPPRPHTFRRLMLRGLMGPIRVIGRTLGGVLQDGIGQGIVQGLKAAGPVAGSVLAAVLLTAVVGAMAMVGAAIAGALVGVIGGAFVVLGGIIAAQAPVIQRNWKTAVENIKKDWSNVGDALIEPMHRLIHTMERVSKEFAPHVRDALAASAPHVETFIEKVISGFKRMGERSAGDLEEGFNTFLAAFGPDLEKMLAGLGDALGALGRTVRDHSTEISTALTGILSLITTAVDIINFFASAWVTGIHSASFAVGVLLQAVGFLVDGVLGGFDNILAGLESVAGLIGLDGPIKRARENLGGYREDTKRSMDDLARKFQDVGENLDHANRKRKLEVDISSLNSKLKLARSDLQRTADKKARAKITADISDLLAKKKRAQQELSALNGRTATTYVKTVYTSTGKRAGSGFQRQAHGGVRGMSTAATGGVRSNMTMVGEAGPEIVNLPPGAHVRSAPDTQRFLGAGGGGGGGPIVIELSIGGTRFGDVVVDATRKTVAARGGNVQAVLGQRGR